MKSPWHPQDIIAAVRKKGSSLQRLGLDSGFGRTTFNRALSQRFPNAHAIIAAFLGLSRHELWPHWYGVDDRPLFDGRPDLQRRGKAVLERGAA
jgi:Ner family transcriptional regulator